MSKAIPGPGSARADGPGARPQAERKLRRWLPACIGLTLVCVAGAHPSAGPSNTRMTSRKAPNGVVHRVIRRRGPNVIHVVRADLSGRASIQSALATGELPGLETTSSMARRRRAVAAINGDFFRPSGRPVATFARDRRLVQTALLPSANFAIAGDDAAAFIGHKQARLILQDPTTGHNLTIGRVNSGRPGPRQLAIFTNPGGELERPPLNACSARLHQIGSYQSDPRGAMSAPFRVAKVVCRRRRLLRLGDTVLSARWAGERRSDVLGLEKGQPVNLTWDVGWPGVVDTLGGNPVLIKDGRIQWDGITGSHSIFRRHPRSGVGVTSNGQVLFVTVDGRRPRYSVGMTLVAFARLFKSLGAKWALNLDGGGSTTMWVRGRVVNRPSDGLERRVGSALLVVMDGGSSSTRQPSSSDPAPVTQEEIEAATLDPASIGGMASWLLERNELPVGLEPVARKFNAHTTARPADL